MTIMNDVMKAIQILHNQDITHRDIKLENILKHDDTWKLAGYGFSKKLLINKDSNRNNMSLVGTPGYVSP